MFGVGADVPVAPGSESIQLQQTQNSTAGGRYQSNVVTAEHLLLDAFCGPFPLTLQEPRRHRHPHPHGPYVGCQA